MEAKSLAAVFLIILLVSGAAVIRVNAADDSEDSDKRTLTVNGDYTLSVDPDTFVSVVVVETQADTAEDAQRDNALIANKVEKAVSFDHELTTMSYTIQPVYEWEECSTYISSRPCTGKQVLVGYKATHMYKFETEVLDRSGEALDDFVKAGATGIQSVRFELSRELQDQTQLDALEKAAGNAKLKAGAIATGSDVVLGKPLSINEGYYYRPVYYDYGYAKDVVAGAAESVPTSITPGQVDISASVSVTYEIF
jgi:uncharacterized protein YggE